MKNIILTDEEKQRMMSGESIVIERSGSKQFVPAVDESIYQRDSAGNKQLQ